MRTDLLVLLALGVAYLGVLSFVAWVADRTPRLRRLAHHPLIYALALGVYASSWTYFGSVGLAKRSGLLFLAVYLGPTIAALLGPTLGVRLLRIVRAHQLASLADLFAFRYRSRAGGTIVTVAALVASLPYIALQVRAVVASLTALTRPGHEAALGLGFCLLLALFAMFFGARSPSSRGAQDGLVVAIAFESVVKLGALLAVGVAGTTVAFGGPAGLGAWIGAHPEAVRALHQPVREGSTWTSLMLVSFTAAFLLPRQFHIGFAEGASPRSLRVASWAFPLYLLLLNLPIVPILWAGSTLLGGMDPDLYVLGVAQHSRSDMLTALAFIGGVSASSSMVIVTMLALASMAMNHLVLLAPKLGSRGNLYVWLIWARRALVALIALLGWATYLVLEQRRGLVDAGVVSFVAFAQFLPGMVGVLAWRRASARGFVAGLVGGLAVWGLTAAAPLLGAPDPARAFGDPWTLATFASLTVNAILFAAVSLRDVPSRDELEAADACLGGSSVRASRILVTPGMVERVRESLGALVGPAAARGELERALAPRADEERLELGALAERLERNLSAMVGPLLANMIVEASARTEPAEAALAHQLRFLDERVAREGARLEGLAAELDRVRRFLGALLDDLPTGACALGPAADVVIWNRALERLTGLAASEATEHTLSALPAPWGAAFAPFASGTRGDGEIRVDVRGAARTLRVHTAHLSTARADDTQGMMLLVEDITERRSLEAQVAHQDRLASLGRLAAGVAHEIGNPLTGISSLAQNLRRDPDPELSRERADDILEQARRIEGIVKSLLAFGHAGDVRDVDPAARAERLVAADLVAEALRLVCLDHASRDIEWHNDCAPSHAALGDRSRLLQLFLNLLTNARDASTAGDRVTIESVLEGERLLLRIVDQGCGIPAAVRARLFDPFVTTKPVGKGTGLGLSVVYGIVREHRGTIEIDSEENVGTTVRVWLPAAEGDG
jgi:signal transduction histidine kinase/Na+/proline symporter